MKKYLLVLIIFILFPLGFAHAAFTPDAQTTAFYNFNSPNAVTIFDVSSSSNNMINQGVVFSPHFSGFDANFKGTSSIAIHRGVYSNAPTSTFTIGFAIDVPSSFNSSHPTSSNCALGIFAMNSSTNDIDICYNMGNATLDEVGVYKEGNGISGATILRSAARNTFHNFVIRNDGSFLDIFVDGILGSHTSFAGYIWNNTTSTIGLPSTQFGSLSEKYFEGLVDDFFIENRALSDSEITGIYTTNTTVNIEYPFIGLSTTDFSTWVLSWTASSSLTNSSSPRIGVSYGQNSSSLQFTDTIALNVSSTSALALIPKSLALNSSINKFATSTWYALPFITQQGAPTIFGNLRTILIDPQTVNVQDPLASLAQVVPSFYVFPSSTSPLQDCGLNRLDGCAINAGIFIGQALFQVDPAYKTAVSNDLQNLKTLFPFGPVFSVIDSVSAAAATTESSTANYDIYATIPQIGLNAPLLTSTTLESAVGSSTKNTIFTFEKAIIWIGAGFKIVSFIAL